MKLYVVVVLLASCGWVYANNIVVGSYDLDSLDIDKLSRDPRISDIITEVILKYDLMLLHGISFDVGYELAMELERKGNTWEYQVYVIGEQDELFFFFYNQDTVYFEDLIMYSEGDFKYAPVAARFGLYYGVMDYVNIAALKIDPDNVAYELNMFPEVKNAFEARWSGGEEWDWLIMGKLNADPSCSKLTEDEMYDLTIWQGSYDWWITKDHDTLTDPDEECTTEGIVSYGSMIYSAIVDGSAHVNRLDEYSLDEVMAVSEYYPVGIQLYSFLTTSGTSAPSVSFWLALAAFLIAFWK